MAYHGLFPNPIYDNPAVLDAKVDELFAEGSLKKSARTLSLEDLREVVEVSDEFTRRMLARLARSR